MAIPLAVPLLARAARATARPTARLTVRATPRATARATVKVARALALSKMAVAAAQLAGVADVAVEVVVPEGSSNNNREALVRSPCR